MKNNLALLICLLCTTLSSSLVQAQRDLEWTAIGPFGGDFNVIAVNPSNPANLFAGSRDNGVFRSGDGGANWEAVGLGLPEGLVKTIVVDPNSPNLVYVGIENQGLYKSRSLGIHWEAVNNGLPLTVEMAAVHKDLSGGVFVATDEGIFQSTDEGGSWRNISEATLGTIAMTALTLDPRMADAIYAGSVDGRVFQGSPAENWTEISNNLPQTDAIIELLPDPFDANLLYTLQANAGVYRRDAGGNGDWEDLNAGLPAADVRSMVADNRVEDFQIFYVALVDSAAFPDAIRVYRTEDGGLTWNERTTGLPGQNIYDLAIDPVRPATIYAAIANGAIHRTSNGGENWIPANRNLSDKNILTLAIDPQMPANIFAGLEGEGILFSSDGGRQWQPMNNDVESLFPREQVSELVSHPNTPGIFFAATTAGILKTVNSGQNWQQLDNELINVPLNSLAIDPNVPDDVNGINILYAGTQDGRVFRSDDNAESWVSLDTPAVSAIFDIVLFRTTQQLQVLVATNNGVLRSNDDGLTWQQSITGLENTPAILTVAAHADAPDVAFAGTAEGVFQTTDAGVTWARFDSNFNLPTHDLLIDPLDHRMIFAGTPNGVYRTGTDNAEWRPVNENIHFTTIQTLVAGPQTPTVLYAGSTMNGTFRSTRPELAEFGFNESDLDGFGEAELGDLPEGAFAALSASNIARLPADAMAGLQPGQLAELAPAAASGFTPEQFRQIRDGALEGFTREHFGMLSVDVIETLTPARLAMIDANEFQQSDERDVARWLVHLDFSQIQPADVLAFLPPDWDVDTDTGELKPPPGTTLQLRRLPPPPTRPSNLLIPNERPDLTQAFGLGGSGGTTLLDELNEVLAMVELPDLQFEVDEEGFVNVVGTGDLTGVRLAFTPDTRAITQDDTGSEPGIVLNKENQYVVITASGRRIPLLPAPRNAAELADALGQNTTVSIAEAGDVLLTLDDGTRRAVLFAPTVINDTGLSPGLNITNPNARGGESLGLVVFGDGSAQQIYPYIPEPDTFETTLLELSPLILSVTFNLSDGTATADLDGTPVLLIPSSTLQVKTLEDGTIVLPSIDINADLTLSYTVQESLDELLATILISF